MKKVFKNLSLLLTVLMLFSLCAISAFASDAQKVTVTTEKTTIYEKASTESQKLISAGKGYTFTPIASTKSFWKLEFKKKNDATVYTGFVLKSDTKGGAITSSSATGDSTNKSSTPTKPSTSYPFTNRPRVKDPRSAIGMTPNTNFFIDHSKYPLVTGDGDVITVFSADIKSVTTVFAPSNSGFEILGFGWLSKSSWDSGIQIKASKRADVFIKVVAVDNIDKEHTFYTRINCQNYSEQTKEPLIAPVSLDNIATGTEVSFTEHKDYAPLRWESSNPSIASIDQHGNMIALESGTTYITAFFAGDKSSSTRVTVK